MRNGFFAAVTEVRVRPEQPCGEPASLRGCTQHTTAGLTVVHWVAVMARSGVYIYQAAARPSIVKVGSSGVVAA